MVALLWVIHRSSLGKPPPVALHKDQSLIAQEDKKTGKSVQKSFIVCHFPSSFYFCQDNQQETFPPLDG